MRKFQRLFECDAVCTVSIAGVDIVSQVDQNPSNDAFEIVNAITRDSRAQPKSILALCYTQGEARECAIEKIEGLTYCDRGCGWHVLDISGSNLNSTSLCCL